MNLLSFVRWFSPLDGRAINIFLLDADGNIFSLENSEPKIKNRRLTLHWSEIDVGGFKENKKFERLVLASLNCSFEDAEPFPPPMTVKIEEDRWLCIDILPLPEACKPPFDDAHALLNFRELEARGDVSNDSLQEHFGLTPCEASLAKALTEGESLKEASFKLDISIWTARSHLRSIFQKTDTHRQAELVSLITNTHH